MLGPLVLTFNSNVSHKKVADRDQTVLRRSKPSSCNILIDEQSNP